MQSNKLNASKENVQEALRRLEQCASIPEDFPHRNFIRAVLQACAAKVPSEESYRREKERRKVGQ
jgi:hypothetical protein